MEPFEQQSSSKFKPSDFMRARRPELYSDELLSAEEPALDRSQFEFHLHTLTQRKEEIRFEHFCRRLAEKEICPNLLPQTGPTGGGDSKVDSETFPVAETIADLWYVGEPERASSERWAFAFSAKKDWRSKAKSDIRKIVETDRNYTLIYFITNQSVSDKKRAEVEDELRKERNVDIRIIDRTWIIDKTIKNKRWDVVYQTLDIDRPHPETKKIMGPIDTARLRELEELERMIEDPERYKGLSYQLGEDCLQTALLARGLGRPRTEIEGRFDRAERIARKRADMRQLFRIFYERAWTAIWWFDDFQETDRLYSMAEPLVINTESIWDLEKLVNLWVVGTTWRQVDGKLQDDKDWSDHTSRLREALQAHAENSDKPTSALWARTELAFIDLRNAVGNRDRLSSVFQRIGAILEEAQGHLDYPVEPVVQIIQEMGQIAGDDETYDEVIEKIIGLYEGRVGRAEKGKMRLLRGNQKLSQSKMYDAIDQFGKAQTLLAQDEQKEEFIQALVGTALGYEAAGLLWAAKANIVVALDRTLYEFYKEGHIAPRALPLLRKLVWIEMQLGRLTCVLAWTELLNLISNALQLEDEYQDSLNEERQLMDGMLGILVLKTKYSDLSYLGCAPGLLERNLFVMARGAALFILGHEETFKTEFGAQDDLEDFFTLWINQPGAKDLPDEAEWHLNDRISLRTVLFGCEIELIAENCISSILLSEALLAFLESFLSTAMKLRWHYSARSYLKITVAESASTSTPLAAQVEEDDCGETTIVVKHRVIPSSPMVQESEYREALFEFFAIVISELQVPSLVESMEELFANSRAQDRAIMAAQSPLAISNIFGEKIKYHIKEWIDEALTENFELCRHIPWEPIVIAEEEKEESKPKPLVFKEGPPPADLFGVDSLKHRNLRVFSPINLPLWDKASWRGLGFAFLNTEPPTPVLQLIYENPEAGAKIFRGWRKRIGNWDQDEWIGVTVITGIDRDNPASYRLAIGIGEEYFLSKDTSEGPVSMVFRMQDMMPEDSTNLDGFIRLYGEAERYCLAPGVWSANVSVPHDYGELYVEKRKIGIVPAWQIGPEDPISVVLGGITNPLIPPFVVEPPIWKTLQRFSGKKEKG